MSYTDSFPTKAPGSSPRFSSSPNSSQSPPPASSHDRRAKYGNSNSQDPGDRVDDIDSINLAPSDTASVRRRGGIRRKYPSGDYGSGSNWDQNGGSHGGGGGGGGGRGYSDDSSNSDHEYYYPDENEQYNDDDGFLGDGLDQVGGNVAGNARNIGREVDRDSSLGRGPGERGVGRRGRRVKDDDKALKLRLDLNLDVEVQLKASVRGDLTLSLLCMPCESEQN
ncbi:hypothetical protein K435DRAFT_868353 [Dendrothele bispora CBS 962.96]|uniref:Uncharacterized protein n=1 Tax=Dendrothele bispora (strain CBS 962.96) TaxID=1314807 RepID=A0A4S8LBY2_DENBC|nr:hypothetical protein K435DRAFT_868353 [Dendrothele bispora CBS 962.96]